jgi:hypothetical protein
MKANPGLIDSICKGDYQLVLVQPEFCVKSNPDFLKMTAEGSQFRRRIIGIVGDEIHLAHAWRTFRERWASLGSIRPLLPGIPVMALSATLTPYVRRFVHRTFDMMAETSFIHRSIDRPNIYLHTRMTESTLKDYRELYWMVPQAIRHPADISPTIIFIDSRGGCKKACSEFWNLDCIPSEWKVRYPWTFFEVSTALSGTKRTQAMAAFRSGLVRLLFATEVAGMGIDFPSVRWVIQWQVTPTLTAASLWQRFGRAARNPTVMGVAILYHTKHALIKPTGDPISKLRSDPAESPQDVPSILALIQAYATSKTAQKTVVDPVDIDMMPPEPEPELYDITGLLSDARPSDSGSEEETMNDISVDAASVPSESSSDSECSEPDDKSDISPPSDCEGDEVYGSDSDGAQRSNKRGLPAVCRGVLWAINTTGCVRGTLLLQFDEVSLSMADLDISEVLDPQYPCCDRHTHTSDTALPHEVRVLLPRDDILEQTESEDDDSGTSDAEVGTANGANISGRVATWAKREPIYSVLYALRQTVWREQFSASYSIFTPYTPGSILSEQVIAVLARKCEAIHSESDVLSALEGAPGISIDRDLKWISAARLFEAISPVMMEIRATIRRGAPRKQKEPFIPPHEMPQAEATPEDVARIAHLNQLALAQHEASQEALQSQRAKQREYQAKRKARFATPSLASVTASLRPTRKRVMNNSYRDSEQPQQADIVGADHDRDSDNSDNSGIPAAPRRYQKQYIPADLLAQLPKIPAGRPTKSAQKERHDIIDAYWASKV